MDQKKIKKIYTTKAPIFFRHADPAGIMFFGNILEITHDVMEGFFLFAGFTWEEWFLNPSVGFPYRHVSADYLVPLKPGQTYDVEVTLNRIGSTSFESEILFLQDQHQHAKVTTVQVAVELKNLSKIPIPEGHRQKLGVFLKNP